METNRYVLVTAVFLVVALASFGVYARDTMGRSQSSQSMSCNRADLTGAIVKNSKGDVIGLVYSVENHRGQSFAIINHGSDSYYGEGGGFTPIPVGALKVEKPSQEESSHLKTVVLNKTEKQLEGAPFWDPTKMDNHKYEARIDRFFGAQPSLCS